MKTLAQQINESFINEGKELEKNTHGKTNNIYVSSSDSKICLQIPYIFPGGELSLAHNQLELLRSLHNNDKLKKEYNKLVPAANADIDKIISDTEDKILAVAEKLKTSIDKLSE